MRNTTNGLCECGCGERTNLAPRTDRTAGIVKGEPRRFIRGHQQGKRIIQSPYRLKNRDDGTKVSLHRLRAEKAYGGILPKGAVVHHADGTTGDDSQLVICQDQDYHLQLHKRMRVREAGGNPWTDKICVTCKSVKPRTEYHKNRSNHDGLANSCKPCAIKASRYYYRLSRSA